MKAEKERRSRSASFVLVSCCCSNYEMSNGTVIKRPSSIHQRPSTSVRLFARNEINHRRLFALAFEKKKRKKEERNQIAKRFSSFFFVEERHLINPNRRNKAIFLTFFFFFFSSRAIPFRSLPTTARTSAATDRKGIGTTLFQFL